jgi:hypothetical protein
MPFPTFGIVGFLILASFNDRITAEGTGPEYQLCSIACAQMLRRNRRGGPRTAVGQKEKDFCRVHVVRRT